MPCHITEPCHVHQDHLLWKCLWGLPCRQSLYRGLYLHSTDIFIDKRQFKWTVRRRVACRVWVSCLQHPGKKIKKHKQRTIEGPEDARLREHLLLLIDMGGKQAAHCHAAIGKANRVLGCIRRGINYKSKEVVLTLYRNFVRATSRISCSVLVTTTQVGHICHKESSVQGYLIDSRLRWNQLWGAAKGDRALYTRKEAVTRGYDRSAD